MKKGYLVSVRITLFQAKYDMCTNHALSGEIFYRKATMTRSENYYPTLKLTSVDISIQVYGTSVAVSNGGS